MKHLSNQQRIRTQIGATLMEVLISLVLFSTGVVALTSNIQDSMDDFRVADFHSFAVLASDDLVDRIKNNPDGFKDNVYNKTSTITELKGTTPTCSTPCTTTELANIDLQQWADTYSETLTHASVKIARSGDRVTIAFVISDSSAVSLADCHSSTSSDAYCHVIEETICSLVETDNDIASFCN